MGNCCSDNREKPLVIIEAKDSRECVDKYKEYQCLTKEKKDKLKVQYLFQFKYKDTLYEIVDFYQEPQKIPDPLYQNLVRDQFEKFILKKGRRDHQEIVQDKARQLIGDISDQEEQEYLLMLNLENQATHQLHEKQVRFFEKLNHPNLVKYLSHQKINFQLTVFKEICQDGSFLSYLEKHKGFLNADLIFDLIEDLCSALRYLYNRAVVDFELSLDMLYVSQNIIKIDLYNCIQIDDKFINNIQQEDGNISNPPSMNNMILTSRVYLPPAEYLDTPQHVALVSSNQKSRIGFEEQIRSTQKFQKYKIDENKINIDFVRLFCIFLLFNQDYRILVKQQKESNGQYQSQQLNSEYDGQKTYPDIDLNKIKRVQRAPKALKEFIVWTMHHIKTLRPNLTELHKEIRKIRYQPEVVTYINQIYSKYSSKNINGMQENIGNDDNLNGYKSHYAKQHAEELEKQQNLEKAYQLSHNQDDIIQQFQGNQYAQNSTQQQQTNNLQNSQNMDRMSGSFNKMIDSQNRGSSNIIKIWEEIKDIQVDKIRSSYNPNDLIGTQFLFFEETYEIHSYLGHSELSVLFRIENIFTNRQKAFTLKISKNPEFNLFLEKEYTILKQFGCPNMIKTYSFVNINNLSGLVLDLYHQNLYDYLMNSSKLDIASQLIEFLSQFLNGLHELHVKNIIHRQLSLESISILTVIQQNMKQFTTGLCNLEFAIQLKNSDKINGKVPLNSYSSPELREQQPYSLQSDIYSAGLIILSTLCNVSAQKLLSTTYPELLPPAPKANMYISHIQNKNQVTSKNNYQKALEQSQVRKINPTQNTTLNNLSESKIKQDNILSSKLVQDNTSSSSQQISVSKIREMDYIQENLNISKMQASKLSNAKQNDQFISLREVLGDKCPQQIIDSFENMISKYPLLRGSCSDYLNEFQKLKQSPEVMNYINMQNKQIRFI